MGTLTETWDWKWTAGMLCAVGLLKEFRPSEPFIVDYAVEFRNFTSEQVVRDILPVTTYSYFLCLLVILLITDFLRYKPVIIIGTLSSVICWTITIWAYSTQFQAQVRQAVEAVTLSTEIAYFTYMYANVDRSHYKQVTSYTHSAIHTGRFLGGITGQFVLTAGMGIWEIPQLNYITLGGVTASLIVSLFLPRVKKSIYFPPRFSIYPGMNGAPHLPQLSGETTSVVTPTATSTSTLALTPKPIGSLTEVTLNDKVKSQDDNSTLTPNDLTPNGEANPETTVQIEQKNTSPRRVGIMLPKARSTSPESPTALIDRRLSLPTLNDHELRGEGPFFGRTLRLHPLRLSLSKMQQKLGLKERIRRASGALWVDFKIAYTNRYVLKWSLWWSIAQAIYLQVGIYAEPLWKEIEEESHEAIYNGIIDASHALLSAILAIGIVYIRFPWIKWGEFYLSAISLLQGAVLFWMSQTHHLYTAYGCYIVFQTLFQVVIIIATAEVAESIKEDSEAFIFGLNTLVALIIQTILTYAVTSEQGFDLKIRDEFVVYAVYSAILGLAFLLIAAQRRSRNWEIGLVHKLGLGNQEEYKGKGQKKGHDGELGKVTNVGKIQKRSTELDEETHYENA